MHVRAKVQSHKDKLKKETNNDTFMRLQNPGTPEGHRPTSSHFNVINKFGQKLSKQGYIYVDKQTDSVKNSYNKN